SNRVASLLVKPEICQWQWGVLLCCLLGNRSVFKKTYSSCIPNKSFYPLRGSWCSLLSKTCRVGRACGCKAHKDEVYLQRERTRATQLFSKCACCSHMPPLIVRQLQLHPSISGAKEFCSLAIQRISRTKAFGF